MKTIEKGRTSARSVPHMTSNYTSPSFQLSTAPSWEPLWTPKEAAVYLRVHPKTVVRLARIRIVPGIKLGKHWRFRSSDLIAWAGTQLQLASQPHE